MILFGLSMDYHVYILSRVREAYDKGMTTEDAVEHGIKKTAGVVTSAAFVMVGVFGIFGTLSIVDFKMLGIGLAVAIFIDATIVRAVLLPATMKLLGDRNWYLPSWLQVAAAPRSRGQRGRAAARDRHRPGAGALSRLVPSLSTPDRNGPPIGGPLCVPAADNRTPAGQSRPRETQGGPGETTSGNRDADPRSHLPPEKES